MKEKNFSETVYLTNDLDDLFIHVVKIRKVDKLCYPRSVIEVDGTSGWKSGRELLTVEELLVQ